MHHAAADSLAAVVRAQLQRVVAVAPIGCHASPNATPEETQAGVTFGEKPAGTEFIVFFIRGQRSYAFDVAYGNYCWIDNNISRA